MMGRLFPADELGDLFDGAAFEEPARDSMASPPAPTCPACGGRGCKCEARGFEALRLV